MENKEKQKVFQEKLEKFWLKKALESKTGSQAWKQAHLKLRAMGVDHDNCVFCYGEGEPPESRKE